MGLPERGVYFFREYVEQPSNTAAIEIVPKLIEKAVRLRVMISTPTTFIALEKGIAYGWKQKYLAENAQAVADFSYDLFDRIKVFGGRMSNLRRSLRQTVDKFNRGVAPPTFCQFAWYTADMLALHQ